MTVKLETRKEKESPMDLEFVSNNRWQNNN